MAELRFYSHNVRFSHTLGFLSLCTIDMVGWIIPFGDKGRPLYCRMFCSIPGNLLVFSIWTKVLATAVIQAPLSRGFLGIKHWYSPEQKKQRRLHECPWEYLWEFSKMMGRPCQQRTEILHKENEHKSVKYRNTSATVPAWRGHMWDKAPVGCACWPLHLPLVIGQLR